MKIRSPNAAIAALDFVTRPINRNDTRMLQPAKIGWGNRGPIYQDKKGRIHGAYNKPSVVYGCGGAGVLYGEPFPLMNGDREAAPDRVSDAGLQALVAIGAITQADAEEHSAYIRGNRHAHGSISELNAVRRLAKASGIGGATLLKTLDRLEKHVKTPPEVGE